MEANSSLVTQAPPETMLQRIDAALRELHELRRLVLAQSRPEEAPDIVAQLAGVLAPTPRPDGFSALDEYRLISDWE